MKVVKPLRLGVLHRTFEEGPKFYLAVTIIGYLPIDEPQCLLMEPALWKLAGTELGQEGVLDECMPKLRGEVLVRGNAYPKGGPAPSTHVRVSVGAMDKTLYVFGDRRWKMTGPTNPEPFSMLPVTWSNAFGGSGFAKNPLGKGNAPLKIDGQEVRPLPNVEDPKRILKSPSDRPDPAGFMPYALDWPQRKEYAGTYDDAWLKERYPGFPRDFDYTFFSVAPPDQRIEGFFRGGEAIRVENMHPEKPVLTGELPKLVARCFVDIETESGLELREVQTKIDTVWLFPHHERVAVLYRGAIEVREDDAADVRHLIAGFEDPQKPKPIEHYRQVLAERLARKNPAAMIRDRDLLPDWPKRKAKHADEQLSDMNDLLAMENLLLHNARRGADKRREEAIAEFKARGLDPGPLAAPAPEVPVGSSDLDDLPDKLEEALDEVEKMKLQQEKLKKQAEDELKAACKAQGLDYDKMLADAEKRNKRMRRFTAKGEIERLTEMLKLADNAGTDLPAVRAKLLEKDLVPSLLKMEEKLNEMYLRFGHYYPPAEPTASAEARKELEDGRREGKSFAGRDFTGADLAGIDLSGLNLEGAFLEGTNLKGANLSRANLKQAVLVRADLTDAKVEGALLAGANLGLAELRNVDFSGLDLSGVVFVEANMGGVKLKHANLTKADLSRAKLIDADLSFATFREALVLEANFEKVLLKGADLGKTVFFKGELKDVDFSEANLGSLVFVEARGERVVFRKAKAPNVRFVKDSAFPGADFSGADLCMANFRGTALDEARFAGADARTADFSECSLKRAIFTDALVNDAMFVRADLSGADFSRAVLMQAILQKARVDGTSFEGANLFRADMARVRGDNATSMSGAFVKRVRSIPARRSGS